MKNLYKKICVVVLSSVVLAGGALVSNSSVSHAYSSFIKLVENIVGQYPYSCIYLGENYKGWNIKFSIDDPWDLDEPLSMGEIGSGIYKVGNHFFLISG